VTHDVPLDCVTNLSTPPCQGVQTVANNASNNGTLSLSPSKKQKRAPKKNSKCKAAKEAGESSATESATNTAAPKVKKYVASYREVEVPGKHASDRWAPCRVKNTPDFGALEEEEDGEIALWEEVEVSITITECGRDLDIESALPRLSEWARHRASAHLVSAERGFSERNLHLQGIARLRMRTDKPQGAAQMCQKELLQALGWVGDCKPKQGRVMVRYLRGEGLHTWWGMIGYVIKNETADDYVEISNGITEEDKRLGRQMYLRLGAGDLKNKTALCPRNLFNKVRH